MRWASLMVVLCGCELYFGPAPGHDHPPPYDDDKYPYPDAPPWPGPDSGPVYYPDATQVDAGPPPPPAPTLYACNQPVPLSSDWRQYCEAVVCNHYTVTGSCTASSTQWNCTPACSDMLCGPAPVQQAIVGNWSGSAADEVETKYTLTLTVSADGRWSGTRSTVVYDPYENTANGVFNTSGLDQNGGYAGNKIFVQGQTTQGAFGTIRLGANAQNEVRIANIRIVGNQLTFRTCGFYGALDYTLTKTP